MARTAAIDAGERDQPIQLLKAGKGQDEAGQTVKGWTDIATVWARVRPATARELQRNGAVLGLDSIVFGISYRPGIESSGAVRWKGKVYELTGVPVNVDGANHTLELITGARPA
jgi:SPP1 family predicted phage head-tail adaptor